MAPNLRLELPITLYEAVLGAKVRVPTLDGAVELAIPADTSGGRTFRLKGKGLPAKTARAICSRPCASCCPTAGDAELEELMHKWRDSKPYDPRKGILGAEIQVPLASRFAEDHLRRRWRAVLASAHRRPGRCSCSRRLVGLGR